jgi:hypothetical protein
MSAPVSGDTANECLGKLEQLPELKTGFTKVRIGTRRLSCGLHHWVVCFLYGLIWVTLEITRGPTFQKFHQLTVWMRMAPKLSDVFEYVDATISTSSSCPCLQHVVHIFDAMAGRYYKPITANCQGVVYNTLKAMGIQHSMTEENVSTAVKYALKFAGHQITNVTTGVIGFLQTPVFSTPDPNSEPFERSPEKAVPKGAEPEGAEPEKAVPKGAEPEGAEPEKAVPKRRRCSPEEAEPEEAMSQRPKILETVYY